MDKTKIDICLIFIVCIMIFCGAALAYINLKPAVEPATYAGAIFLVVILFAGFGLNRVYFSKKPSAASLSPPVIRQFQQQPIPTSTIDPLTLKQIAELTEQVKGLASIVTEKMALSEKDIDQKIAEQKKINELKRLKVIEASLDQIQVGVKDKSLKAALKPEMLKKQEPEENAPILTLDEWAIKEPEKPSEPAKPATELKTLPEPDIEKKLFG
jgi:hypothetical protein